MKICKQQITEATRGETRQGMQLPWLTGEGEQGRKWILRDTQLMENVTNM